ncbi:hypothetical protein [Candidatus Frankia alpina]|uniref:hypothetical protein n=1 Tax=Candidatus Frankia alpina TaxID=2699483 RepID=UPI0013D1CCC8|nr:hypothetical protein [Candidatus Frankia alpina]
MGGQEPRSALLPQVHWQVSPAASSVFAAFAPEAQQVLDAPLDKFEHHGSTELSAQALRVAPLVTMGSVTDLTDRFGGAEQSHSALNDLTLRLFEAT